MPGMQPQSVSVGNTYLLSSGRVCTRRLPPLFPSPPHSSSYICPQTSAKISTPPPRPSSPTPEAPTRSNDVPVNRLLFTINSLLPLIPAGGATADRARVHHAGLSRAQGSAGATFRPLGESQERVSRRGQPVQVRHAPHQPVPGDALLRSVLLHSLPHVAVAVVVVVVVVVFSLACVQRCSSRLASRRENL